MNEQIQLIGSKVRGKSRNPREIEKYLRTIQKWIVNQMSSITDVEGGLSEGCKIWRNL